jgi:hypothetical protein
MTDELWRVVHRLEAAAERAERAASAIEAATNRVCYLLEDGYSGNGLRLIELLESVKTTP